MILKKISLNSYLNRINLLPMLFKIILALLYIIGVIIIEKEKIYSNKKYK